MPKTKPGQSRKGKNKQPYQVSPLPVAPVHVPEPVVNQDIHVPLSNQSSNQMSVSSELVQAITQSVLLNLAGNNNDQPQPERHQNMLNNVTVPEAATITGNIEGESSHHTTESQVFNLNIPADDITQLTDQCNLNTNTNSLSTPIAALIDAKIKQKIWQDQYVDLAMLLPQNCIPGAHKQNFQFLVSDNSTLSLQQSKPRVQINSIEQWTTAFLRYIAIYSERFPHSTPHLLKHAEVVRTMATTHYNDAWLTYDQQVRLDRQTRGLPWDRINMESDGLYETTKTGRYSVY